MTPQLDADHVSHGSSAAPPTRPGSFRHQQRVVQYRHQHRLPGKAQSNLSLQRPGGFPAAGNSVASPPSREDGRTSFDPSLSRCDADPQRLIALAESGSLDACGE